MTQTFTPEQLRGFLDGTLEDESLITAIEAAINADPALADEIEALASKSPIAAQVRAAFDPVLAASVPQHLIDSVAPQAEAKVVDIGSARTQPKPPALPVPANDSGSAASGWRWPQFAAMAACLAIGVMVGGPLLTGGGAGGTASGGSLVLASADVTQMLDTAPSGKAVDLAALGEGEVVLTFRNADGQLCRQFALEAAGGTSDALACADAGGDWQIEAYGRRAAPAGEMKLAGGDAAPGVVAAVDAMIDSDPLVGADEAAQLKTR
jgi:hypothetical protein